MTVIAGIFWCFEYIWASVGWFVVRTNEWAKATSTATASFSARVRNYFPDSPHELSMLPPLPAGKIGGAEGPLTFAETMEHVRFQARILSRFHMEHNSETWKSMDAWVTQMFELMEMQAKLHGYLFAGCHIAHRIADRPSAKESIEEADMLQVMIAKVSNRWASLKLRLTCTKTRKTADLNVWELGALRFVFNRRCFTVDEDEYPVMSAEFLHEAHDFVLQAKGVNKEPVARARMSSDWLFESYGGAQSQGHHTTTAASVPMRYTARAAEPEGQLVVYHASAANSNAAAAAAPAQASPKPSPPAKTAPGKK
jgi:hypothetical protein